ncbi:uncharacterized protein YceK [Variovorax boronicumulans]|uniref:Uncharacterized protein YceK n=1 Tax=Variovorax boronicumulans TaxID=436515 RepID=A0AAW8D1U3_9BURK|nr:MULTISPECIES: hypothetical protein [Variovorax]MDP9893816.1 uncharacterized protein YceK [Variovorax boronicumulans]MDQ0053633.1 uncharacterized protein YceK [Variovorax boronicumulans]MDQ0608847.1 uncharacterized protein YceK [Variovorax sp. W1I1]
MIRLSQAAVAAAVVVCLSGCASIFNGTTQPVAFSSAPQGAAMTITNRAGEPVHIGTTPSTVTLKRGAGYFKSEAYTVTMKKEGFADASQQVDSQVSGWYVANIMLGGLLGMLIVDPASGGMYTFPDTVKGTLAPTVAGVVGTSAAPATVK